MGRGAMGAVAGGEAPGFKVWVGDVALRGRKSRGAQSCSVQPPATSPPCPVSQHALGQWRGGNSDQQPGRRGVYLVRAQDPCGWQCDPFGSMAPKPYQWVRTVASQYWDGHEQVRAGASAPPQCSILHASPCHAPVPLPRLESASKQYTQW